MRESRAHLKMYSRRACEDLGPVRDARGPSERVQGCHAVANEICDYMMSDAIDDGDGNPRGNADSVQAAQKAIGAVRRATGTS